MGRHAAATKLWHGAGGRRGERRRRRGQPMVTDAAFEPEARFWCRDRGLDPDALAPCIAAGSLPLQAERLWQRRARQLRIAAEDRADRLRRQRPVAA